MKKLIAVNSMIIIEEKNENDDNDGGFVVAQTGNMKSGIIKDLGEYAFEILDGMAGVGDEIFYLANTAIPVGLGFPNNIKVMDAENVAGIINDCDCENCECENCENDKDKGMTN
jgi:hypothetical protein